MSSLLSSFISSDIWDLMLSLSLCLCAFFFSSSSVVGNGIGAGGAVALARGLVGSRLTVLVLNGECVSE